MHPEETSEIKPPSKSNGSVAFLRVSAVALLFGGILLALLSGAWSPGAIMFGLGAILLGLGQFLAAEDRPGHAIGGVIMLTGLGPIVDGAIRLMAG